MSPHRLMLVRDDRFLDHDPGPDHPESPDRLRAIHAALDRAFPDGLPLLPAQSADDDLLALVHTRELIDQVAASSGRELTRLAADTYAGPQSAATARLAAGSCVAGLEALVRGQAEAILCLVRPPGHHALPGAAGGFCIFNNLALAARHGLERLGLERILILDWDVHHGNALEEIFYQERRVFYLSTHYPAGFPHTGNWDDAGLGPGAGATLNLPIPKETGDRDLVVLLRRVLPAVVERFAPQAILVAAGFDGHRDDPLGNTRLTARGYAALARMVMRLARGRGLPLLLSLEGGYDLGALGRSVVAVAEALREPDAQDPLLSEALSPLGEALADQAERLHSPFGVWTY